MLCNPRNDPHFFGGSRFSIGISFASVANVTRLLREEANIY